MSRFTEMFLEIPTTRVYHVSADLTRVFLAQTVEFVQPKGDGFTVPTKREFERIVNEIFAWTVFFFVFFGLNGRVESLVL
jgi:hypothetical protein